MQFPSRALLLTLLAPPVLAQQALPIAVSPLEPATTGGIQLVDRALAKLTNHRRLLIVGAHPDDEDTTLLAYVATALGGEAAYLSLSRGEGGQNLIGTELGIGLGQIRTGELMGARRIEGTRQFFTRAYDFGYTRSLDETWSRWPRAVLEEDAVRVVRRFKPQVIVAIFSGDNRAGHGQHQAAGVVAESVFGLAGEPDRYPGLTAAGLPPWQPEALYRRVWQNREEASMEFSLDAIDPLRGKSILQIAGASRSMHRSQDMGTLQPLGRRQGGLIWLAGEGGGQAVEVFGGLDTELSAIARLLQPGPLQQQARERLEDVARLAQQARENLAPSSIASAVPALGEMVRTLRELEIDALASHDQPAGQVVADLLSEKLEIASIALLSAAGIVVDAIAEREVVTQGETLPITVTVWNSGRRDVEVKAVDLRSAADWRVSVRSGEDGDQSTTGLEEWFFDLHVPDKAPSSVPYYLRRSLIGDLYQWEGVEQAALGEPLQMGPAEAVVDLVVAGVPVRMEREVVYRTRDQAMGEVRRPIRVVPRVEVAAQPGLVLWPTQSSEHQTVEVILLSNSREPVAGHLALRSSGSWPAPVTLPFSISEPGGQQIIRIDLERSQELKPGRIDVTVTAILDDGSIHDVAYPVVDYPHIRPQSTPVVARLEIEVFDLEIPSLRKLGYVRGAADRVPEILSDLGLPVHVLSTSDLETADLSSFDAIVIGSRAYETDPVLAKVNSRLLDYVRGGGRMVVQYQKYQFFRGGFSPLTLEIARPHGRVTDETAPVVIVRELHGVFSTPNQIEPDDWLGWVQERGLYFASEWDPGFQSLLELQDEGQPVQKGAILVADVGEGLYVYTGLSFFRQLPAGVPGAIRLFVNLLALERS